MTLVLGLLNSRHEYSRVLHEAASLTFGVVALIVVALSVVLLTYRHAGRARGWPRRLPHPRRGTSALLLGVIATVLLTLTSASQHRLGSLTIVSRASAVHGPSVAGVATHPLGDGLGSPSTQRLGFSPRCVGRRRELNPTARRRDVKCR